MRVRLFLSAVLISASLACRPGTDRADAGASQSAANCYAGEGTLPRPTLTWSISNGAWVSVLDTHGVPGPQLDVGTSFYPAAFLPERDVVILSIANALKVLRLSDGSTVRYLARENHRVLSWAITPSRDRLVVLFAQDGVDGGAPSRPLDIFRLDATGNVTDEGSVGLEDYDVTTEAPYAIDDNRMVLQSGYWSSAEGRHREVFILNLTTRALRSIYTPPAADDFLFLTLREAEDLMLVALRPHTDTGATTGARMEIHRLSTGELVRQADLLWMSQSLSPTYDVNEPVVVVDADSNVRTWRPWLDEPPSEPLGHALQSLLGATISGDALALAGLAPDRNSLKVFRLSTGQLVQQNIETTDEQGTILMTPRYLSTDGTVVVFDRTYYNGSDFFGGLGTRLMSTHGCTVDGYAAGRRTMFASDPLGSDGGMALYILDEDAGALRKVRSMPPDGVGIMWEAP